MQAKENADDLLKEKQELQARKEMLEKQLVEKKIVLDRKAKAIGNYVHDSVTISDNEVRSSPQI